MTWFHRKPEPPTREEQERWARARRIQRRDEAAMDRYIEADERSQIPCEDCETGEPHVCERAYWQQRFAHITGQECADPECVCHPEKCPTCKQPLDDPRPVNA